MRPTRDLYQLLEKESIVLRTYDLKPGCDGLYVRLKSIPRPHIIIASRIVHDPVLYRAVLAHEIGHHYTLTESYALQPRGGRQTKLQDEILAEQWAINFMVRPKSLINLAAKGMSAEEAARLLAVPVSWVEVMRRLIFNKYVRIQG